MKTNRDPATLKFAAALVLFIIAAGLAVTAATLTWGPAAGITVAAVALLVLAIWFLYDATGAV
jgi:hypothetical protein